jgi:hypothetical protein
MMNPSSGSEDPMSLEDNEIEKMVSEVGIVRLRQLEENKVV